jgi:hypothetical protein
MIVRKAATLLVLSLFVFGTAGAKSKKEKVSAAFRNARFVYVQSIDGDALDPRLYPEDREAIFDVQQRMRDWNRYTVTFRREEADLVIIVRKGRSAAAQARTGIAIGRPAQPNSYPGQASGQGSAQPGNGPVVGVGAEVGPSDDLLRVFIGSPDGKLLGPVWSRELEGGLDTPSVELVRQLKDAVEEAYPQSSPHSSTTAPNPPQPQAPPQAPPEPQAPPRR